MGEERKIVVEHFPVAELPEHIRARIGDQAFVRLTIETEVVAELKSELHDLSYYFGKLERIHDDPVADIRKLRDEWE